MITHVIGGSSLRIEVGSKSLVLLADYNFAKDRYLWL
jgi:hypothetical protein